MGLLRNRVSRRAVIASFAAAPAILRAPALLAASGPDKFVLAFHVTISPAWFDPSAAPPQITPFGVLYALHDALVRAYPGTNMGPALAESWQESEDGLTYEFKLRPNLTFHNGDPLTTEDVKFSFDRYQGAGATIMKEKVASVEIVDPHVVRFHLKEVWPDFMTFYGSTASAAGLIVPKKYIEKIGDDEFKQKPVGAGPYKFVSGDAGRRARIRGIRQILAQNAERKDVVMRSVPDGDYAGADGEDRRSRYRGSAESVAAQGLIDDPRPRIVASKHASCQWIEFPDQCDPKSPWHDLRMRQAVAYAIDREGINKAACLGFCPPAGVIIPRVMEFALQVEPFPYDPQKAKQLLAEAGHPNGIDAGLFHAIPGFPTAARGHRQRSQRGRHPRQAGADGAGGVLCRLEGAQIPRAVHDRVRRAGNAASRVESLHLFERRLCRGRLSRYRRALSEQASERDAKKREAILDKIQQLTIDRMMFAPIYDFRALMGVGPRIAKDTIGEIYLSPWPEYEDIEMKAS